MKSIKFTLPRSVETTITAPPKASTPLLYSSTTPNEELVVGKTSRSLRKFHTTLPGNVWLSCTRITSVLRLWIGFNNCSPSTNPGLPCNHMLITNYKRCDISNRLLLYTTHWTVTYVMWVSLPTRKKYGVQTEKFYHARVSTSEYYVRLHDTCKRIVRDAALYICCNKTILFNFWILYF